MNLNQLIRHQAPSDIMNNIASGVSPLPIEPLIPLPKEAIYDDSRKSNSSPIHREFKFTKISTGFIDSFKKLKEGLQDQSLISAEAFPEQLLEFTRAFTDLQNFTQARFKQIKQENNLQKSYKEYSNIIDQFQHQVKSLDHMNDILFETIERYQTAFKDLYLSKSELNKLLEMTEKFLANPENIQTKNIVEKIFKSVYSKDLRLKDNESINLAHDIIEGYKHQVLVNLAKIFSSKISSDDSRMTDTLNNKRFKNIFHTILDLYKLSTNIALNPTNPFLRRNYSARLLQNELLLQNMDELTDEQRLAIETYLKSIRNPSEKKLAEMKVNDLKHAIGYRKGLVENVIPKLLQQDFRTTVNIIRNYIEETMANEVSLSQKYYTPDSPKSRNDIKSLAIRPLDLAQTVYHSSLPPFNMGSINENRATMATIFLKQLIDNKLIDKYLEEKKGQHLDIGLEVSDKVNFTIEKIINCIPRGAFDISGSDLILIIKVPKDSHQDVQDSPENKQNAQDYQYQIIPIQIKSGERSARESETYKYPDTPAVTANQNKPSRKRILLEQRKHSLFSSGATETYSSDTALKAERRIDPDLPLKLIRAINRASTQNFRTISSEQMQDFDTLLKNPKLFTVKGGLIKTVNSESEIELMNCFREQGFLRDLCLAYQKYPNDLLSALNNGYPKLDNYSKSKFTEDVNVSSIYLSERLGHDTDFKFDEVTITLLHNAMCNHRIESAYLRPIVFKMLAEYEPGHEFSLEDIQAVIHPYKNEADRMKRDLNESFKLEKTYLEQYLRDMLNTNRSLNASDVENLIPVLIEDKNSFGVDFYHRIQGSQSARGIIKILTQISPKSKTPSELTPINLKQPKLTPASA
jgi:hypothetical protein